MVKFKWVFSFSIESLVVISNPRTIIKASDDNLPNKIIHSANLPHKIKWFESKYKKNYKKCRRSYLSNSKESYSITAKYPRTI